MSDTRYCSSQKTSGEAGGRGAPMSAGLALALRGLKSDSRPSRLRPAVSGLAPGSGSVSAFLSAFASVGHVQVSRGCPRRPWTNMTLCGVRACPFGRRGSGVILQSGPVAASALATGKGGKAVAVDPSHASRTDGTLMSGLEQACVASRGGMVGRSLHTATQS
jgi:hypothetical protein